MKKLSKTLRSKSVRVGSYSVLAVAIVLAILIAVNLLLNALPAKYTMFDLSRNLLYSFSDQTKKIVSEADRDITVYWICQSGSENSTLEGLLNRYASLGTRLTVKKIDPDNYPTFATKYEISEVKNNCLVVESDLRYRYISYDDIFVVNYVYDDDGNLTGSNASLEGESEITSAISFVLNPNPPKVYSVTGHGEKTLSETFLQGIESENMTYEDISLITLDEIPEDCNVLMLLSPVSDLSEHEAEVISEYLATGGRMILITAPHVVERTNLNAVMAAYKVSEIDGTVVEADSNYYYSRPDFLMPEIEEHDITQPLIDSKLPVFMPQSHGIKLAQRNINETITPLLSTTRDAYSKIGGISAEGTYEQEEGDIDGAFTLAVLLEQYDDEYIYDDTIIAWFGCENIIDDTINSFVNGANLDLFLNTLSYLSDNASNISIHSKNLMTKYLTIPSSASTIWSIVLIGLLPVAVMTVGIVIFARRRKR